MNALTQIGYQVSTEASLLQRHADWFDFLALDSAVRESVRDTIESVYVLSRGMMHHTDVVSLTAAVLHCKPVRIFEIGTYRGASAELLLRLLPDAQVISIAFVRDDGAETQFNNDELPVDEIGMLVGPTNRKRFTQLIGDSHQIDPDDFVRKYGRMDFVFIDGDHTREGVRLDTELARAILAPGGAIAWHDANPLPRFKDTKRFLERELPELALATNNDFRGGVALWSAALETQLRSGPA